MTGQSPRSVWIGLWHALWGVTSALLVFCRSFACLSYQSSGTHYDRWWSDDRSTSALVRTKSSWVRGRRRGHHPAPHRMHSNKRSFFFAATAIEIALLLGYSRSQYTGIWSNDIISTSAVALDRRYCGCRLIAAAATRGGVPTRRPLLRMNVPPAGVGEQPLCCPAPGGLVPAGSRPASASPVALCGCVPAGGLWRPLGWPMVEKRLWHAPPICSGGREVGTTPPV